MLSEGNANKEKFLQLAKKGIEISEPKDIVKDPYVFEFLGIPEYKPFLEKDIENALFHFSLCSLYAKQRRTDCTSRSCTWKKEN